MKVQLGFRGVNAFNIVLVGGFGERLSNARRLTV